MRARKKYLYMVRTPVNTMVQYLFIAAYDPVELLAERNRNKS